MNTSHKRGLTLLELIIVTSLIAVISLVLFSTFQNGMKIFRKACDASSGEEINIMLERIKADIHNCFAYSDEKMKGTETNLMFPTLVHARWLNRRTTGSVSYFYDKASGVLTREEWDYSAQFLKNEPSSKESARNIRSCTFSYCIFDPAKMQIVCTREWNREDVPAPQFVTVALTYYDGMREHEYGMSILVPVGRAVVISGG